MASMLRPGCRVRPHPRPVEISLVTAATPNPAGYRWQIDTTTMHCCNRVTAMRAETTGFPMKMIRMIWMESPILGNPLVS